MKKCVMFLICVFLLVGCQVHSSQPLSSQFHEKPLDRKVYQYHDYLLYIYENDEKQKGFTSTGNMYTISSKRLPIDIYFWQGLCYCENN